MFPVPSLPHGSFIMQGVVGVGPGKAGRAAWQAADGRGGGNGGRPFFPAHNTARGGGVGFRSMVVRLGRFAARVGGHGVFSVPSLPHGSFIIRGVGGAGPGKAGRATWQAADGRSADKPKGVTDVERIIGDAHTGAVTLDDCAAFGFAFDADDVEVGPQPGGFQPHGTASGPDVPQRAPCRKPQP